MGGAVWGAVANAALQAGTAWMQSDAQRAANKTNIKNSREQREFEERMSNTAIQRRADDIEKAGGNRALAFVNGSEASTPTYTPARVEAPQFNAPQLNTAALIQRATIDNIKSQTFKNSAETEATTLDNDFKKGVLAGKIDYTNMGNAADLQNKLELNKKIRAETENLMTETEAKKIANFIANNTKQDAITAIKSGAIISLAHIDTEGLKGDKARIWRQILGILETED